MDFGAVGLDHHHHHHNHHHNPNHHHNHQPGFASNNVTSSSDPETKHRTLMYGSEFSNNSVKQERSTSASLEEYWRSSKLAKTSSGGDYDDKGMAFQQRSSHSACNNNTSSSLLRSNNNNNTSTSSTATTLSFLDHGNYSHSNQQQHQMLSFSSSSPNHSNVPTLPYSVSAYTTTRNSGYNNMNGGGGGGITMRSGGFTASQWMELEHQALIFKYITANVPIPSNLLIPIRKAFDSCAAYASFPSAFLRPNPLGGGWGAFQLGFSNNADPEPGRCRRTDGKKWRCSRDAVADQKYCERHMNRGRHRSRKPVEGQVAAGSNSNNNSNANANAASNKPAVSAAAAGGATSSITSTNNSHHHHLQSFDIDAASNRMFAKENCTVFPRKQQVVTYDMSSKEFGLVTSVDSLLNPTTKHQNHNHHHHEPSSQNSLHQFIEDWPNKPTRLDMDSQTDRTQLSISIPNINNSETNLSPLRLSRRANWIPIAWEASSLGGPLGEVLNQPNNSSNNNNGVVVVSDHSKSSSSTPSSSVLNLMPEGAWDSSPPVGSSPTGVLQKTAFGSLSNSSAGSSPTRTNPAHDLLGVSLPAL